MNRCLISAGARAVVAPALAQDSNLLAAKMPARNERGAVVDSLATGLCGDPRKDEERDRGFYIAIPRGAAQDLAHRDTEVRADAGPDSRYRCGIGRDPGACSWRQRQSPLPVTSLTYPRKTLDGNELWKLRRRWLTRGVLAYALAMMRISISRQRAAVVVPAASGTKR